MHLQNVEEIVAAAADPSREGELHELVQRLRETVGDVDLWHARKRSTEIERALGAISAVLHIVLRHADPMSGDAGHGPGHWCRDFVHALRLTLDPDFPVDDIVPAVIAGTLHDIGTLFVDRYSDRTRVVRHAEVGALIVRAALRKYGELSPNEVDRTAYAIAAHTNYLNTQEVQCADGVTRTVVPYVETDAEGAPIMSVMLPRWADRLDCNGPCFVGRHYLTLARDHFDHGSDGFYAVTFNDHLRPVQRSSLEIRNDGGRRTMVEHLRMFADSQTNDSPYGKYDHGVMCTIRDRYRSSLLHVLDQVLRPTAVDRERANKAWTLFLGANIDPSPASRMAAHDLSLAHASLDAQQAWACGFRATMTEYLGWANEMLSFLDGLPSAYLRIPGVFPDVREVIRPNMTWVGALVI